MEGVLIRMVVIMKRKQGQGTAIKEKIWDLILGKASNLLQVFD